MDLYKIIFLAIGSFVIGLVIFSVLVFLLKRRLAGDNGEQRKSILRDAQKQVKKILEESQVRTEERLQLMREELEANITDRGEDLKVAEEEFTQQEHSATLAENQIKKQEKEIELFQAKVSGLKEMNQEQQQKLGEIKLSMRGELETRSGIEAAQKKRSLEENIVEERQLEAQKVLKSLNEELTSSSKRLASRMLARGLSRYAPQFFWPKAINSVEIKDRSLLDVLTAEDNPFILQLRELSGVNIDILVGQDHQTPIIKLAGGFGMYREAARLTAEELHGKPPSAWSKTKEVYERHRIAIEAHASKLGRQAVRELKLNGIHPEIQKMVGSLNWRTSYRQNQFLHTVEVARLAGMLAGELGVDPDMAKRTGLLHDIGKSIDYRIEGSHAVISGDYADRFGETRLICDAVMSHHNDLRVETPLAWVLKAADTLSGARPGARVNLEEDYQVRLSAIADVVRSFPGVVKSAIMNGGREVHVEVNHKKVTTEEIQAMSTAIAKRIEQEVQFPGQIKVLVTRRFEVSAVA